MNYDPANLQLVNISTGNVLSQDGQAVALVHREDENTGTLQFTATRPPGAGGVSGQGTVVSITFMAKAAGQTPLTITRGGARDPALQAWPELKYIPVQEPVMTGAAKIEATTMEPNCPGPRLSGPDDWKNRMSSGAVAWSASPTMRTSFVPSPIAERRLCRLVHRRA